LRFRLFFSLACMVILGQPGAGLGQVNAPVGDDRALGEVLGHPGYLIICSVRDSTAGFQWRDGPGPHQISLTWPDGILTLPDSLVLEPFGELDLAVPVTAQLAGSGAGGKLVWRDGAYPVSEPVMITDGIVGLMVSEGELEINGTRIRYRAPETREARRRADPRASFLMLAGILLLIGVLLRRARNKIKESA